MRNRLSRIEQAMPRPTRAVCGCAAGFSKAWLRCPIVDKRKRPPVIQTTRGRRHHWRPVDPNIPRQVASPQSLALFLRAFVVYHVATRGCRCCARFVEPQQTKPGIFATRPLTQNPLSGTVWGWGRGETPRPTPLARQAGQLKDLLGEGFQAAITEFPDFEHLEAAGRNHPKEEA